MLSQEHTLNVSSTYIHWNKSAALVVSQSKWSSTFCLNAPTTLLCTTRTSLPMAAPEDSHNTSTTWNNLLPHCISWMTLAPPQNRGWSGSRDEHGGSHTTQSMVWQRQTPWPPPPYALTSPRSLAKKLVAYMVRHMVHGWWLPYMVCAQLVNCIYAQPCLRQQYLVLWRPGIHQVQVWGCVSGPHHIWWEAWEYVSGACHKWWQVRQAWW